MITATPFLAAAVDAKLEDWGPLDEASSRSGPASTGLLGPCERPVRLLRREPQRVSG